MVTAAAAGATTAAATGAATLAGGATGAATATATGVFLPIFSSKARTIAFLTFPVSEFFFAGKYLMKSS